MIEWRGGATFFDAKAGALGSVLPRIQRGFRVGAAGTVLTDYLPPNLGSYGRQPLLFRKVFDLSLRSLV